MFGLKKPSGGKSRDTIPFYQVWGPLLAAEPAGADLQLGVRPVCRSDITRVCQHPPPRHTGGGTQLQGILSVHTTWGVIRKINNSVRWPKYCHSYRLFLEFDLHIPSPNLTAVKVVYTVIGSWKQYFISSKPCFGEKNIIFEIKRL